MKEKRRVGFPLGILNKIEIPRFINGLVKSITASRAKLIVIAPMAMSAVPPISSVKPLVFRSFDHNVDHSSSDIYL